MFFVCFVVIFSGVVVFGYRESVVKLKKNKVFFCFLFFYNETEYTKNYGESFHFFCGLACCEYVWLPRKCGKVENFVFIFLSVGSDTIFVTDYRLKEISVIFEKFPDISYQSSPRIGYKICLTFFIKKHKMVFGNMIMICRERLCFSA